MFDSSHHSDLTLKMTDTTCSLLSRMTDSERGVVTETHTLCWLKLHFLQPKNRVFQAWPSLDRVVPTIQHRKQSTSKHKTANHHGCVLPHVFLDFTSARSDRCAALMNIRRRFPVKNRIHENVIHCHHQEISLFEHGKTEPNMDHCYIVSTLLQRVKIMPRDMKMALSVLKSVPFSIQNTLLAGHAIWCLFVFIPHYEKTIACSSIPRADHQVYNYWHCRFLLYRLKWLFLIYQMIQTEIVMRMYRSGNSKSR